MVLNAVRNLVVTDFTQPRPFITIWLGAIPAIGTNWNYILGHILIVKVLIFLAYIFYLKIN